MDLRLDAKRAFISGSTQGIGLAIARQLLEEGADVIIKGREERKLYKVVEMLKQEFPQRVVSGSAADYSQAEEVRMLLDHLQDNDILVNNVEIYEQKDVAEISDADLVNIFNMNVLSGIRLSRHLLPGMLERDFGRIIFIP